VIIPRADPGEIAVAAASQRFESIPVRLMIETA
jgi:hypothetical protein